MVSDIYKNLQQPTRLQPTSGASTGARERRAPARTPAPLRLLGVLSSGEQFAGALGIDISGAPKPIRLGIDFFGSPIGLASTILAPVTAGTSLGLAGAAGTAARVGTRLGAEALVGAAATAGARGVEQVLPEDTPGALRLAAMLAGGAVAGGAAASGIARASGTSAARAAARRSARDAAEAQGTFAVPRPRPFADEMADVASLPQDLKGRVAREINETLGINPSANVLGPVGTAQIAHTRTILQNDQAVTVALASTYPSGFNAFRFDADGFIQNAGTPRHWLDAFSEEVPAGFNAAQMQQRDDFMRIIEDVRTLLRDHGIERPVVDVDGRIYVPRQALSKDGTAFRRPSDSRLDRLYDAAEEAARTGKVNYADPAETLRLHVKTALDEIADKNLEDAIVRMAVTREDAVLATREGQIAVKRLATSSKTIDRLKARIEQERLRNQMSIGQARAERSRLNRELKLYRQQTRIYQRALDVASAAEHPAPRRPTSALRSMQLEEARTSFAAERSAALKGWMSQDDLVKASQEYRGVLAAGKMSEADREALDALRLSFKNDLDEAINGNFTVAQMQARIDDYKTHITNLRQALKNARVGGGNVPKLQKALKAAREKQAIRRKEYIALRERTLDSLPGVLFGRGSDNPIPVGVWRNYYLPKDADYDRLVEFFNPLGGNPSSPHLPRTVKGVEQVGNLMRFTAATADFAMPFVQGLPLLALNPVRWAKMAGTHYRAFFDPSTQGRYIQRNIDDIRQMIQAGVPIGDVEMFKAIEREGLARGLKSVPGLGKAISRFQTSYDTGLLVARTELWKSLKPVWRGTDAQLGKEIRNLTGGLESKALGLGPTRRAIESMVLFAPKMLRSTLALVGDATRPWTPQGELAARTLARIAAASAGVMVVANVGVGLSRNETQAQIEQRIRDTVNPVGPGRKFLSVPIGDHYYGIGGQVRSITQLLSQSLTDPKAMFTKPSENPLARYAQGRLSPFSSVVLGGAELTTGNGDILPYNVIDSLPDLVGMSATSMLPFALQSAQDNGFDWTHPVSTAHELVSASTASEILGSRTSKATPIDALNQLAQQRYGMDFGDLTGEEQKVVEEMDPEATKLRDEFGSQEELRVKSLRSDINTRASESLNTWAQRMQTGLASPQEFKDAREDIMLYRLASLQQLDRDHPEDFGPATSDKRRLMDAYFATFDESKITQEKLDWDHWNTLQAALYRDIDAGRYGNPTRARQFIDERNRFGNASTAWFDANQEIIRDSGYWDLRDVAFEQIAASARRFDPTLTDARALDVALQRAVVNGNQNLISTYAGLIKAIDRITGRLREVARINNPDLDVALFQNGYVTRTMTGTRPPLGGTP